MPVKPGEYLDRLIGQLGHSYGSERSIKLAQACINTDRVLLSIHRNALGSEPETVLSRLLQKTGCPEKYVDYLTVSLTEADIVHFGYEGREEGYIYKCYLEFARNYHEARRRSRHDGALVHYAVKWASDNRDSARISRYHCRAVETPDEAKNCIAGVYGNRSTSVAYSKLLELMALPAVQNLREDLMLMLVTEEGNSRLSFDLNLYDAGFMLSDIDVQLRDIADYFGLDKDAWDGIFRQDAGRRLGHLAGGLDANDNEFFTVYFGVEERLPARA